MDSPKRAFEIVEKSINFGILSPYLHSTADGGLALTIHKCLRYDCDYFSHEPGYCKIHKTELVMFVFVMK